MKQSAHPPTETVSDYKYKCDCACHLVVPDELNNCDCIRFHTSPSEHDWELIKEGRAMSDRDTRRGI